jgi:hypothetical protein
LLAVARTNRAGGLFVKRKAASTHATLDTANSSGDSLKKNINRGFSAPLGKRASGDDLQDRVTAPASFTPRPALWLSFGVEN